MVRRPSYDRLHHTRKIDQRFDRKYHPWSMEQLDGRPLDTRIARDTSPENFKKGKKSGVNVAILNNFKSFKQVQNMTNLEVLQSAHANFDDMEYDVDPAKSIVKKIVNKAFPNDCFDILRMECMGDGIMYIPQINGQNTQYSYVISNTGKGNRIETMEGGNVGFASSIECGVFVDIMGFGNFPANIEGFSVE